MKITIQKKKNKKKGVWVSTYKDIRENPFDPESKLLARVFPIKVEFYDDRVGLENIAINYELRD